MNIKNIFYTVIGIAAAGFLARAEEQPRFSHPREITNPYLPLGSLTLDILEGKELRIERKVRPKVHKVFTIGDQTVEALAVEDREIEDGDLKEVTLDYFAQDDNGQVYYLGEDVDTYKNGKVSGHEGQWLLGRDTQKPGVIMPAHPKVGDKYKSEDVPKITWEEDEIVSVTETVTVPAGTYENCIKVKERTSDGDTEYKLFAPGVGCVKEIESEGEYSLKSHKTGKMANLRE
jgi:hypothetical protein